MSGFDSNDPEFLRWERSNLRGLGRRQLIGREQDSITGGELNVYWLVDDDEWFFDGERELHERYHRYQRELGCRYCRLSHGI